jgi:hypothetical protein
MHNLVSFVMQHHFIQDGLKRRRNVGSYLEVLARSDRLIHLIPQSAIVNLDFVIDKAHMVHDQLAIPGRSIRAKSHGLAFVEQSEAGQESSYSVKDAQRILHVIVIGDFAADGSKRLETVAGTRPQQNGFVGIFGNKVAIPIGD